MSIVSKTHIYFIACLVRALCIFAPGYVHPDEYFQSYEVAVRDVLGKKTNIPWEFADEDLPLRTPLSPMLAVGLPLTLLKMIGIQNPSPWTILFAPRVFLFLLSFVLDAIAWSLSRKLNINPLSTVLTLSTSWVTCVMHVRPFSNTLESLWLGIALWLSTGVFPVLLGIVAAIGFFNRFTFIFFFPPIALYAAFKDGLSKGMKRGVVMAISFVGTSAAIVLLDALYFGHVTVLINGVKGTVSTVLLAILTDPFSVQLTATKPLLHALTPLNFFIYNSNPANLALHGLHPRYLHLLVNIPMVFGPLGLVCYVMCGRVAARRKKMNGLELMLLFVVILSVCILSINPHQEARFLIPLLLPLSLLFSPLMRGKLFIIWIAFNVVICVWFGALHQSGVVSSVVEVGKRAKDGDIALYHHTYMPPLFLLTHNVTIIDMKGCNRDEFDAIIKHDMMVVAPANVQYDMIGCDTEVLAKWSAHVSGEDWPHAVNEAELWLSKINCA